MVVPLAAASLSTAVLCAIALLGWRGTVDMSGAVGLSIGLAIAVNVVALVLPSNWFQGATDRSRRVERRSAGGEEAWYRVRNGIASIQSSAELAMDHASPTVYEYLEDILAESQRCNATVSRVVGGGGENGESGSMRRLPASGSAADRPNASTPRGRGNLDTGVSPKETSIVSHRG